MNVSVIICTYALERYGDFVEAVDSVIEQSYDAVEIVIIVDGNKAVTECVQTDFGDTDIVLHTNKKNRGVSYSRTKGAEIATGDIVAFIDDDALADPDWVTELVETYEETDALAVGGQMTGLWPVGRPWYLPREFDWLVGVTHPGFAEPYAEIRNTFESNISFRRDVFLDLGGFDPSLGPNADSYRHSEGAELGSRLQAAYDRGVIYNPDAIVTHKVFPHRTQLGWLLRRGFQQGQSKRRAEQLGIESGGEEFAYLWKLVSVSVPRRLRELVQSPSLGRVAKRSRLCRWYSQLRGHS
jgi:glycosyltransferase involved in cell wall biosynthesis